jgi:alpha-galactosidase
MGFNPYNCFGGDYGSYDEHLIKQIADAIVSTGLREVGYEYVNLDAGWGTKQRDPKTGRLVPNDHFPGIADGSLAKYLKGKSLRFGIYGDEGTNDCGGSAGNLGHEELDAQTFADWGVEFLKSDNCNVPANSTDPRPRYERMSAALNKTGKPIFFALCEWGVADPATWAPNYGNSWRTTGDISDVWWAMTELADLTAQWFEHAGPGGWNDPDLLEVGNSGMTTSEHRCQMSIWALIKAPLIISTDIRNMSAATLSILANKEVVAVNQDAMGVAGRLVEERPPYPEALQVWAGPLSNGRVAVVLWNRSPSTQPILGRFVNFQLPTNAKMRVRNVWAARDEGVVTGQVR